jgi:hypothetical protein
MRKFWVATGLALITTASPLLAAQTIAPPPGPQDETQIDALVNPVLAGLKANNYQQEISRFFNTNSIMQNKTAEVENFKLQVTAAMVVYGPIKDCQFVEKSNRGQWSETRLYICQHEKYLTRWIFDAIKSPSGWQAGNLRWDDKYTQELGS